MLCSRDFVFNMPSPCNNLPSTLPIHVHCCIHISTQISPPRRILRVPSHPVYPRLSSFLPYNHVVLDIYLYFSASYFLSPRPGCTAQKAEIIFVLFMVVLCTCYLPILMKRDSKLTVPRFTRSWTCAQQHDSVRMVWPLVSTPVSPKRHQQLWDLPHPFLMKLEEN